MIKLRKFIGSRTGVIICSILLGLGLSSIFKMSCDSNNCIIMKAPDMSDKKVLKYLIKKKKQMIYFFKIKTHYDRQIQMSFR